MTINSDETPIFVRGLSRSGGTLMVTMLDAHPDIAMSYELYPTLLELQNNHDSRLSEICEILQKARSSKQAAERVNDPSLKTFILRAPRGGMDISELATIFANHLDEGRKLDSTEDRLELIAKCCRLKMEKEGKRRWGLKCNNKFQDYLTLWPNAYFLNMLRDGRDVLASQLRTGSFTNSPAEVGKSWINTHAKFRELVANPDINAYEVKYETLVTEPESEIKRITAFLKLPFEQNMLEFHKQKLTIYTSSHLSMKRISGNVDATQVGRWKKELTATQITEFNQGSDNALAEFGYDT